MPATQREQQNGATVCMYDEYGKVSGGKGREEQGSDENCGSISTGQLKARTRKTVCLIGRDTVTIECEIMRYPSREI